MAKMSFDEEGLLEDPCLSCDKCYVDDLFYEWCCDEKECSNCSARIVEQQENEE